MNLESYVLLATLHLLYARFIAHFLCKIGLLETKEPFKKLLCQVISRYLGESDMLWVPVVLILL